MPYRLPRSLRRPAAVVAATLAGPLTAALTAALAPRAAGAQLAILRTSAAAPLDVEPGRRFPTPAFVGDFARGYGSTEDARAWNLTLAGLVQLRTRSGRTALVGRVGNEMTANPYNSGGLNPRGTAWEENVYLLQRVGSVLAVSGGVFFRCRHEIDGATPIDERPGADSSRIGTRIVMNKGVELGLATRELAPAPRVRLRAEASVDRFTAREDWRLPNTTAGPYWTSARGRVAAAARLSYHAAAGAAPYVRGWASTTWFGRSEVGTPPQRGTGGRLEAGVRLGTRSTAFDVFAAGEHYFDDLANPVPQRSRVLAVGVRAGHAAFF